MADPASLVGLGVGLISLGLQTYSGITTYLDAIDCRDEELLSVRRQNDALHNAIAEINKSLPRLSARQEFSAPAAAATCLTSCEMELKALQKLVAELAGSDTATPGRRKRMKQISKALMYAFDRPKLHRLETRLGQTVPVLQLALQTLNL